MYEAVGEHCDRIGKRAFEITTFWREKYESWREEIPERIKQNQEHFLQLDKYWQEKQAAQKSRFEAESRAREAEARARKTQWHLNFLRRNLEAKMEAMDVPHGFACLQTSLQSFDYKRASRVLVLGNNYDSPPKASPRKEEGTPGGQPSAEEPASCGSRTPGQSNKTEPPATPKGSMGAVLGPGLQDLEAEVSFFPYNAFLEVSSAVLNS